MKMEETDENVVKTGLPGLDAILRGGLPRGRAYLLEGSPGAGKTTLGLQFLLEGLRRGERVMLVSLIETRNEIVSAARSHNWDVDGIHFMELPKEVKKAAISEQTVFHPGDVEFGEIADAIVDGIEQYRPQRLVLDSISQLSMMTDNYYQMRRSILSIRDLIHELGCTTVLTSSEVPRRTTELDTIVHGAISLNIKPTVYGRVMRELIVKKMRGRKVLEGYFGYRILTGGLRIYSRPYEKHQPGGETQCEALPSGMTELDDLLGGGLEEGTACLLVGSPGAGKSTLGSLYVREAAKRGERSIVFCFDERKNIFLRRCASLNMDMRDIIDKGLAEIRQVEIGELSPGEFAQIVYEEVEKKRTRVVMVDSLTGYLNVMPDEKLPMTRLHELLDYLGERNVLTIMTVTRYGVSEINAHEIDASYISDTVILLRHFEAMGNIRHCIAVIKKRYGAHEHAIREFKISARGCEVGPPLTEFRGLLTGNPVYVGKSSDLLRVK